MKQRMTLGSVLVLFCFLADVAISRSQGVPGPHPAPDLGGLGTENAIPLVEPPEAGAVAAGEEPSDLPELPDPAGFFVGHGGSRLGVVLVDVTPDSEKELKLHSEGGAIVKEVRPGSAAAKAGLEKNDVILQFAGERVRSVAQLSRLVRETPPGRTVNIEISRGGQSRTLSAKLEAAKSEFSFNVHVPPPHVELPAFKNFNFAFRTGPTLGISGDELTTQLANYFGVKQGKGVLVREVVVGSAAEKAGLKAGDVIVQVEGKPIGSVGELRGALGNQTSDEERKLNMTIVRDRREQTLTVELERPATVEPRNMAEQAVRDAQKGLQKRLVDLQRQVQSANVQATRASMQEFQRQIQAQQYELQKAEKELQRQVHEQMRKALEKAKEVSRVSARENAI